MTRPNAYHPHSEELFAYRDGELPAEKRSVIEAHVVACALCRERIDDLSSIESDLRLRPDAVGEEYYARMTDSVLARLQAGAGAPVPSPQLRAEPAPEPRAGSARVDRRRPLEIDEDPERVRRSFRLPWIGITGTAAAAVAVVVVVVMLAQRQGEWLRAPRPGAVGEPQAVLPSTGADSMAANRGGQDGLAGVGARRVGSKDRSAAAARDEKQAAARAKLEKSGGVAAPPSTAVQRSASPTAESNTAGDRKLAVRPQDATGQVREEAAEMRQDAAPSAARFRSLNATPGEPYAEILRTHRLPIQWDSGVSSDALLGAEADLRLVYQTGRAGADSARIRLYLAEAERLKLSDPPDATALGDVAHHYRRVIALAGSDAALANLARRRLADLLQRSIPSAP